MPLTPIQVAPTVQVQSLTGPVTATFGSATTAGNTLVACVTTNGNTTVPLVSGVTLGGAADNWQQAFSTPNTVHFACVFWYDPKCATGQTSVAVTCSGGAGTSPDIYVTVYEVPGILVFDQSGSSNNASGTTWTSGASGTTTRADEIFFGVCTTALNAKPVVTGAGTWTTQGIATGSFGQVAGYQIVSAPGTATFSGTTAAATSTAAVATFKLLNTGTPKVIRAQAPYARLVADELPRSRIIGGAPATAASRSAGLSGSGTLGGTPALAGTAALSGSGMLGGAPALAVAAAMSGSGTLAAAPAIAATYGAALSAAAMGVADTAAAITAWQSWTGLPLTVRRAYSAPSVFTYTTDLSNDAAALRKVVLDLRPAYNPTSSTDLANMSALLTSMSSAGLRADITLWAEPFNNGLTAAQYQAMIAFYGPTVRGFYPLVFCTSVYTAAVNNENAFWPGAGAIDKVATDYYADRWVNGFTLDQAASLADGNFLAGTQANFDVNASNGGWTGAGNCTATFSSAQNNTAQGLGALALTSAASGNMTAAHCAAGSITTLGMACAPGDVITCQAWFRAAVSPRNCQTGATFYTSGGVVVSTLLVAGGVTDSTSAWTQVTGTVTAPATAAFCRLVTQVTATGAAAEVHYMDDAWLANASVPLKPFGVYEFNGNTTVQTFGQVQAFFAYLKGYRDARTASGKAHADYLLFNGATSALTNTIISAADYRVGLYDLLQGVGIGAATLSGSGTLSGLPLLMATAAMTGSGSLTAAPAYAVPATLAGSGTLSSSPSISLTPGPALSGAGTLGGAPYLAASSTLSGSGTLSGPWTAAFQSPMSGSGTLSASPAIQAAAALSGSGTLTAGPALVSSATLSGSGTLSAAPARPAASVLSGSGTLSGSPAFAAAVVLSGSGSLSGLWALSVQAALSGSGTLAVATGAGSATLTGSGTLSASPVSPGASALTGSGTLAAAPVLQAAAALSGSGTLAGAPARISAAALSGSGTLSAAPALQAAAALAGTGTLAGTSQLAGLAGMSGTGTLSSALTATGAGALTGTGTLAGAAAFAPATVLTGTGTLNAAPGRAVIAGLSGSGTLAGASTVLILITATLSGAGTLTATAVIPATGNTGTATWTARAAAPRWNATAAGPRWEAGLAPARWNARNVPARWQAGPAPPRWRILMAVFDPIAAVSLEEINIIWTSDLDGTRIDPIAGALTVQFAVPVSSGDVNHPAQPVTWYAASWLAGGTGKGYIAQGLVGPAAGTTVLVAGQKYDVWGRILGSPEQPAKFAGVQAVY